MKLFNFLPLLLALCPSISFANPIYLNVGDAAREYFTKLYTSPNEVKLVSSDKSCAALVTVSALGDVTFTVQDYATFTSNSVTFPSYVQEYRNSYDDERGNYVTNLLEYSYSAELFSLTSSETREPYNNDPHEDLSVTEDFSSVAFKSNYNDFTITVNHYSSAPGKVVPELSCTVLYSENNK